MSKHGRITDTIKNTLKLQPIVVLYSLVSVGSKLASNQIPRFKGDIGSFFLECMTSYRLILIFAGMFLILGLYAIMWQHCIKTASISVMYANKSSYIFWTQLAAVLIFGESLNGCNIIGILIIFVGIMVVNGNDEK